MAPATGLRGLVCGLWVVLAACAAAAAPQSSSSTSITTTTTTQIHQLSSLTGPQSAPLASLARLRLSLRPRRPEACREALPRKAADLPALVVVGRVREVYLQQAQPQPQGQPLSQQQQQQQQQPLAGGRPAASPAPVEDPAQNRALVGVQRVIKGQANLEGADIVVSDFNSSSAQPCPNFVKPNDTLILLLNPELGANSNNRYAIHNNNLLAMNLNNLERVNALAADEPYKRRSPIEDILCEAHYCAYGRCVAPEGALAPACKCPDSCPPLPAPVCGSDNVTYTNECQLIREGCNQRRPLFVTRESAC